MLFNSAHFLIFFPIVLLVYFIIPSKIRYLWLLICSYYFYMCWNAAYVLLIFFSTFITYLCSLGIEKSKCAWSKKLFLVSDLALNLSILVFFKYFTFIINSANHILSKFHLQLSTPTFDILLPVGISFYTFQALGYTIDVYRKDIYAEHNFFKYALFVSFFPQLVAGPIERSKNLLTQLAKPSKFDFYNFRDGILLMLWGYFQKMIIADRIALFVDSIYDVNSISSYSGFLFVLATFLFAFQIYCDFSGYSTIAMGCSKILGITLMENFSCPYLAENVSDFWRRWHISLSSWFRDYLYIPLGGNRKGKKRKYFNIFITFVISGLWHGASWSYVIWGGINGLYQIIGNILAPLKTYTAKLLHINSNRLYFKVLKIITTFLLIDFTWIFFRADSLTSAISIIKKILMTETFGGLFDDSIFQYGLNLPNFILLFLSIIILITADILKNRHIIIREVIQKQHWFFQVLFISFSIWFILVFGVWGKSYDASAFIYFQF